MPTLTEPNSYALNGWRISNDVWNPDGLVAGQDYTISINYNAADLANGLQSNWVFPARGAYYVVHAYPEILFGPAPWWGGTNPTDTLNAFPIQVSDIAALTANYNISFSGDTQGYDVAYDIWLTDTPNGGSSTITNEIMIWVHEGGFSPAGTQISTYTDQYFSGSVYYLPNMGTNPTWKYTAFVSNGDSLSGHIDIAGMIQSMETLGIISPTEYVASIEFGAEVAAGQGSLTLNNLDIETQTLSGTSHVLSGLIGTSGNDTLVGGPGIQTAVFSGARSAYTIKRSGKKITITGPGGTDTLTSIEKVAFDDQTVLLGRGPMSADFNTDLNSDILWQNTNGQAAIWFMNGTTELAGSGNVGSNLGTSWKAVGSGDFNGDGHADILWRSSSGRTAIWFMNGTTKLSSSGNVASNLGTAWKAIGSGDFNGDGKADILWQSTSGQARIWFMSSKTVLSGSGNVGSNLGTSWKVIGSGDFNGDGKSDILWQSTSGQVAVWLMNGKTKLSGSGNVGSAMGTSWKAIGTGDFNGDGKADILFQNTSTGLVKIWEMNGTTKLLASSVGNTSVNSGWTAIGTGDFNGDGKADILFQNANGQAKIWLMNGVSKIVEGLVGGNPGSSWHAIATGG